MKGLISIVAGSMLLLTASVGFAQNNDMSQSNMKNTGMDSNWVCTTNASSASTDADKAADQQMANTAKSATDAFAFASTNCRDCTKITCEVKNP